MLYNMVIIKNIPKIICENNINRINHLLLRYLGFGGIPFFENMELVGNYFVTNTGNKIFRVY